MPASLTLPTYLDGLTTAAARLREDTTETSRDAPVPTCAQWSALQLLVHTGVAHRWASGTVRGTVTRENTRTATEAFEDEGMSQEDPGNWLLAGVDDLSMALQEAPEDLNVFFFLNEAPAPRQAWARRQCHETTIHAFDGLAARYGYIPKASDADIDPQIAADGIDEILCGFATRKRQDLRTSSAVTVAIRPDDVDAAWTLHLSDGPAACEPGLPEQQPDSTWSGTAAQLYLGLWNRGKEIEQDGADVIGFWRDHMRIQWN